MKIPKICLEWIRMQRSGYKNTEKEFIENMKKEYDLMSPYLPEEAEMILDIGCGVGGIDILLSKHYDTPHLLLMDSKQQTSELTYGFDRGVSYYNSFEATKALMKANSVYNYSLLGLDIRIEALKDVDLIVSILSWGYHYPVDKYIKEVASAISDDGVLIMDIRQGTDGISKVREYFPNIQVISDYNKSNRICARRK